MLEKLIFRKEVKEILLAYILEGRVRPGDRISLPKVASSLEVSVTPIREALTQLAETGIVTYIANRGFFVTELSKKEATEIYDLIALLEAEAVKNSAYTAQQLEELRDINEAFHKATSPKDKVLMDRKFHQTLIQNHSNSYAHKIIEDLRVRITVYEHAFMNSEPVSNSYLMHKKIIDYLSIHNKSLAMQELHQNWRIGIDDILTRLRESEGKL